MKIMFCLGGLEKGGAERVASNLCNYFCQQNDSVVMLLTRNKKIEYEIDKRIKIFELDKKKYNNFLLRNVEIINQMKQHILKEKPDIIISFLDEPTFRILLLKKYNKKIKKISLIVSLRNAPEYSFNGFLGKIQLKLYNQADGYVFQTKEIQKFFNSKIQRKSMVIQNPINESFLVDKINKKRKNKIVSVGRLEKQKNYPLLLEAFSKFRENHNDYHLYIYGDGSLLNDLKTLSKKLKISEFVHFEGKVDNLKEKIIDSKMFVMSSDYEGLSNALMEAMALGLTCISTDSTGGGAASIINNMKDGILVPKGNATLLAKAMNDVADSEKLSKTLSENAFKKMKNYSPDKINEKWYSYIKVVVSKEK